MDPSTASGSGKGKAIDMTTEWSKWTWMDGDGGYWVSSRYGPSGELEYEYDYYSAREEQGITSNSRENVMLSVNTTQSYQAPPTLTVPYYPTTASAAFQGSARRSPEIIYTPQLITSSSFNSLANPSLPNAYGSSSSSSNFQSNQNFSELSSRVNDMSLSAEPIVPKEDHLQSSGHIRMPTDNQDREMLDPRYCAIPHQDQKWFWRVGRVFSMLWTEPASTSGGTRNGTHYSTVYLGGNVYSEIRRFVVMRVGYGNNICSPIHTYSGQATLKPNLPEPLQHTIIYTSNQCPPEHWYTAIDGTLVKENLTKDPIKVQREQEGEEGDLGQFSRLNYSKIYTVENYVRVLNIGIVETAFLGTLSANSFVKAVETLPKVQKPNHRQPPSRSSGSSNRHHRSNEKRKKGRDSSRTRH